MYLCIYVSMYVCMYLCMYVSLYVCIFVCMYVCIFVCMYVSIYLPIYLSIYLPIHLSIYLPIYLSIYISLYMQILKVKNNSQRETHSGFRVEVHVWDFAEWNGARQFFALPKLIRDWEQTGTWCWHRSAENAGSTMLVLYCNRFHHCSWDVAVGENLYVPTWYWK